MNKVRKVTVILTAAGSGSRFKGSSGAKPKQFLTLNGKPVILHSLMTFQKSKAVNEIIISANTDYFELLHSIAGKNRITKLIGLVEGGKTRFESVKNAFLEISSGPDDVVLIHDAARPNISAGMVNSIIEAAFKYGEVIPAFPVSETVKRTKKNIVIETLDREDLWLVQTPQAFRYKVLESSYKKAGRRNDFTDESSLVEASGFKVRVIEGSRENIKITTREDIMLLKKLMQ